jgi:hypothetical protein
MPTAGRRARHSEPGTGGSQALEQGQGCHSERGLLEGTREESLRELNGEILRARPTNESPQNDVLGPGTGALWPGNVAAYVNFTLTSFDTPGSSMVTP